MLAVLVLALALPSAAQHQTAPCLTDSHCTISGHALTTGLSDEAVLIQLELSADRHASVSHMTRFGTGVGVKAGVVPESKCQELPAACEAPFNCRAHTHKSMFKDMTQTTNGHPNPNAWCHTPYLKFAVQCIIEKDLVKAAHTLYDVQSDKIRDLDAQYCFAAGHCNTTSSDTTRYIAFDRSAITENTTLEVAEEHCNKIYGETWKHKALLDFFHANADGLGKNNEYAQMACAMGNWHCDVTYCREFYCHSEQWKDVYGYKAVPGSRPAPHYPPAKHHSKH